MSTPHIIQKHKLSEQMFQTELFDHFTHPVMLVSRSIEVLYYNKAAEIFQIETNYESFCINHKWNKQLLEKFEKNLSANVVVELIVDGQLQNFQLLASEIQDGYKLFQFIKLPKAEIAPALGHTNKALDEFSYIISHDLIEPVRTIRSFAQIIKKTHFQHIDNPEILEDFEFLSDASNRLYEMILAMLDYSRLNNKYFEHEQTDSLEVLVEVIKDLMAAANESNASVLCHNMPIINFNKTLLTQVFSNLISNSLKYKSDARTPRIEISAEEKQDEFLFTIKDNGIGIDNEHEDRIFKIFQRLHPVDSKYSGTGMGLAICNKIIEREGGKIWYEGIPGKGTSFYFTILKS